MNPAVNTALEPLRRVLHEAAFQSQLWALGDALAFAGKARKTRAMIPAAESGSAGLLALGAALETASRAAPVMESAD